MKHYSQIVLRPLVSEKGMHCIETRNVYPFEVARSANKIEICRAIQEKFAVEVVSVRTMNVASKPRRQRYYQAGRTREWKKALVKLKEGDKIEFV